MFDIISRQRNANYTAMRYQCTPIRITKNTVKIPNAGKDVEKLFLICHGWEYTMVAPPQGLLWQFLTKQSLPFPSSAPLSPAQSQVLVRPLHAAASAPGVTRPAVVFSSWQGAPSGISCLCKLFLTPWAYFCRFAVLPCSLHCQVTTEKHLYMMSLFISASLASSPGLSSDRYCSFFLQLQRIHIVQRMFYYSSVDYVLMMTKKIVIILVSKIF